MKLTQCERCQKLERALANLQQEMLRKVDLHHQTIEYLIGISETLTRAAEMLLEMRAKSEVNEAKATTVNDQATEP